jgi:thiopeptide-type bacteriocin biosynthesis protein
MNTDSATWLSLHVFLSDSAQSLRFINTWLSQETRQLRLRGDLAEWFFIRYWEGGPHLRLRFKLTRTASAVALRAALTEAAQGYLSTTPVTREAYYSAHAFDGEALDTASLSWYDEGSVVAIEYQPEWVRYGGAAAMAVSEQLFHVSSEIALALARKTDSTLEQHLASALGLMLASAQALSSSAQANETFFHHYAEFWRNYNDDALLAERQAAQQPLAPVRARVAAVVEQLQAPTAKTPERIWWQALQRAQAQWRELYQRGVLISPLDGAAVTTEADYQLATQLILSSQIHMMNNRLGIIPAQECYLARLLTGALQGVAA